ncbi:ubiquitin-conjugating enzyme family protein [Cryptococcus gattii E566]|nr:ubiquitin-conjugating enzyme family protein [Cryptococcus gattii E566]
MGDRALSELIDMGIPLGRAVAALKRSKGDAMSAAERVFTGEFDDIPSDGEEEDGAEGSSSVQDKADSLIIHYNEDSSMDEDEMGHEDDEDDEDDMNDDNFDYDEDMSDDEQMASDPYAGIFFSKDRVEDIIEPIETEETTAISIPGINTTEVKILGRGEWMSGCPESGEQSFLFQLYNTLEEGRMSCSAGCGHSFTRKREDFFCLFPKFPQYTTYLNRIIRPHCPQCHQITCLACGERVDRPSALHSQHTKDKAPMIYVPDIPSPTTQEALLHCPNLQGVILGVGLHMIEKTFSQSRDPTSSTENSGKTPPSKKRKTNGNPPLAAGKGAVKGTGYAGNMQEDRTGQIAAEKAQKKADQQVATILQQVQQFLPNPHRAGGPATSDYLVHPTALAHLRRRSAFMNDLLRNDSLFDMSQRGDIYRALFDWLEIVSNNESLASMLGMPQMRQAKSVLSPTVPSSLIITYEGAPSPRELLENVVLQAKAALKGLEGVPLTQIEGLELTEEELRTNIKELEKKEAERVERESLDENSVLKAFCSLRIIKSAETIDKRLVETKGKAFVQRMKEQLPRIDESGIQIEEIPAEGQTDEETIKMYEEWATRARFQYVDLRTGSNIMDAPSYKHAYSALITDIELDNAPKRSLAIAKELAILTTSLPVAWHSSVFLRVDEARLDVLKAMIIGPEGTPYENGCLLFDIFLPLEYNQRCPLVKYMTTNGGKWRYNPNLYSDGKVCLSLLGTWQGPGWIAGQSTLLQVLISIQSLILCEEPYLNEPGWANMSGSAQSKAYNANIRRMVLADAMANNIKNPPHPFENEIKTHFRLKAKAIRQQIEKWREMDDSKEVEADYWGGAHAHTSVTSTLSKRSFEAAAKEVLRLLDELEGKVQPGPKAEKGGKIRSPKEGKKKPPL